MKLAILTTGGTIDKTYNEHEGSLLNDKTMIEEILRLLRLPDLYIKYVHVMNKDSLDMTEEDRKLILNAVNTSSPFSDAILIIHGTDTLSDTGEYLYNNLLKLNIPIILTGAMRPYEFRDSDAQQNVTEALLATRMISTGIWVAMHNRLLEFPGIIKDRKNLTFSTIKEIHQIT
ncbi:MAG: asparaginase [Spirochaetales bacterium]|nr:asparaginase [Spirochaetales bacterium]